MLTIRQAQLTVFSQLELEKFEDWMLAHLHRFFPGQCAAAGEAQLQSLIQAGIKRAAAYRITSRRDVCKYIDLMVVFGRDFETDRRFPKAVEVLEGPADAEAKIAALYEIARDLLNR